MSTAAPIHTAVQDFLEQFRGLMRFGWVALVVAWGTAIALWIVVFSIPNTYEATARVFVDPRTTLNEATQGISLGDDMESQIERVREAITGEPQLETVAQETNLLVGALTPKAKQGVIDDLRQNLDITGMFLDPKDSGDTRGPESAVFTISYRNSDRTRSLAVVDRLLSTFVENSLGGNQQGSEQAQQFLEAQISDYGKHLTEAEQRLADFKRRNVGLMPQDQQDYFTRLQAEMTGLNQTQEALAVDIRKRDAIEKEIKGGQAFIAGSSLPMGGASGAEPTNIEQQIEQAQHQLDQLVLKFTDNYPDVIALRRTLRELKDRQKAEIVAARNGDPTAAAEIGLAANPVYQQLEVQYNQAQVDIASVQQDIADREKRIASFRAQMGAAPAAQAEYSQLTRDYDVTKTQYDALLQRLDRARLGQQAAATGTIRFQIIDPPSAKYTPVAPNRPLLIIGAFLCAVAAGLVVAYGLNLLRPTFVSSRQLAAVTGRQVLGSVSLAWYDRYRTQRRRGGLRYVGWSVALVILGTGVLLLQESISHIFQELIA